MLTTNQEWAESLFSKAELGDPRRTKRLIKISQDMLTSVDNSLHAASPDPASIEGAYRFIRNDSVAPQAIAEAAYSFTDTLVSQRKLVLAIQDTTGLSYRHSVCEELGAVNSSNSKRHSAKGRTLYAHSTLMLDAQTEQVLGLGSQHYWHRDKKQEGNGHQLQLRNAEDKESFKWQRNLESIANRLPSMDNVIDVCDREADIYDYLAYQQKHEYRFIVRASDYRLIDNSDSKLNEFADELVALGQYKIKVAQKGGRKARTVKLELCTSNVSLRKPQRAKELASVNVNFIYCREVNHDNIEEQPLKWLLYTSESVDTFEQARKIVRYYELRWRIEEFHKVWKSDGTRVESLRMQQKENLMRVAVIKAFIAVRLMQIRDLVVTEDKVSGTDISCDVYLSELAWKILWKKVEKKTALPNSTPSLRWAYYGLAHLGKWKDTARTGKVGVKALWQGWEVLMILVESYNELRELDL
jgi:hypothetical protein